jgi:hypothetical protein
LHLVVAKREILQIPIVVIFQSNTHMMTASKSRQRPSIWKPSKSDDGSEAFPKLKKYKATHLSIGQAVSLAALSAALAAVVTALIAVYCFTSSLPDLYTDQMLARGVISHTTLLRSAGSHDVNVSVEDSSQSLEGLPTAPNDAYIMMPNAMADRNLEDDGVAPNIAWLMSFPNR